MNRFPCTLLATVALVSFASAALPEPLVKGLKNPESVAIGLDGRAYVTIIGEFDKDGDGEIVVIEGNKTVPFAKGLNDPKGIVAFKDMLYVADKKRVLRFDKKGKETVLADEKAFPTPPLFLNDIAVDEKGTLYVSDSGDFKGGGGAIFRIDPKGKVTLVADSKKSPILKTPNGLLHDSLMHLLVVDFETGELNRLAITDGKTEKVADGFGGGDGLIWDRHGRLYITDYKGGKVFVIPHAGAKPILLAEGFQQAADLCLDATNKRLLVPDMKGGTVTAIPAEVPGAPVDETPLALQPAVAFPDLEWTGWEKEVKGKLTQLRPIVLTHAGDGSNRVFVAEQRGAIHVFPNDQAAKTTKVFLDLTKKVHYQDNQNEEGLLGLCFHPRYKENGEFFVFYNPKTLTTVLSRFKVSKDNPDQADPGSEEILFKIERPFWNHAGGTITFGPDGFLYMVLGDGGKADDPFENGQNLKTLLGKILRLDVNQRSGEMAYAIPKDNPFVNVKDAKPEIWCYGLRNPWRIAFDKETGACWCADVGQNLWEEINLLTKGGNFGWNIRESLHPFSAKGVGQRETITEPIWEYHHDVGKSITGGHVYRGKKLPELVGHYLYADYVTNKLWALKYDAAAKRVVSNRPIPDKGFPVMSFGEDEMGEAYFLTYTSSGKGIYQYAKAAGK